jgi:beta-aspartyl-peptidase (threonine type)
MKYILLTFGLVFFFFSCNAPSATEADASSSDNAKEQQERPAYAIVIHGGAGSMRKDRTSPEREKRYLNALNAALDIGENILKEGGSSLDAVEQVITYLENDSIFNAGKGAVFSAEGRNELDASIMDGSNMQAGAVGGLNIIKNPIKAARVVMEKSPHVLLVGAGAEQFVASEGVDTVSPSYFYTQFAWDALQRAKENENKKTGSVIKPPEDYKYGTVGCVALDNNGNIAAGTSTGGMTNKKYNRLGDVPVIAAGTYADNSSCGVSCTGHGEFFIRYAVAHDLSALVAYKELPLAEAADFIINDKLKKVNGAGGLIAIDRYGNVAMPFNTSGMPRGYAKPDERVIKLYQD